MRRHLWPILVALPLLSLPAQGAVRYRLESKSGSRVELPEALKAMAADEGADLSSIFGAFDDKPITTTAIVSMTTRDSAGGVLVHLVLDSIVTDQFASLDLLKGKIPAEMMAMVAIVPGAALDAYMLKGNAVWSRGTPKMNVAVNQLERFLTLLIPYLPQGTKPGSSWSDTLRIATVPTKNPTADEAMVAGLMATSEKTPTVTSWRWLSADSLVSSSGGSSDMALAKTIGTGIVSAGTQQLLLDAARTVRQAFAEFTTTTSIAMGEMGSVSTIASNTLTVTRLGARP